MAQSVIRSGKTMCESKSYYQFQVMEAQSCAAESEKVRNLRKLLEATREQMRDAERIADDMEFWSRCGLIAGFVTDTAVGFLEVGAGMMEAIPGMDRAGYAAKAGAASVKSVRDAGEFLGGGINGARLSYRIANNVLSVVKTKGVVQQAMLGKAKTELNVVGVAVKDKSAGEFGKEALMENADLITAAAGGKAASYFKGVKALEGVVSAAMSYDSALNARFEQRLKDKISADEFRRTQRYYNTRMLEQLNEQLTAALNALNACVASH